MRLLGIVLLIGCGFQFMLAKPKCAKWRRVCRNYGFHDLEKKLEMIEMANEAGFFVCLAVLIGVGIMEAVEALL